MEKDIFSEMAARWPSEIVSRGRLEEFSGGLINGRTMANIDSDPDVKSPPRIRFGRKIGYPVVPLTDWMRERSVILNMEVIE